MKKPTAEEFFNHLNDRRVIKWGGLSDGGKWTRALEAMEEYAQQSEAEKIPAEGLIQWIEWAKSKIASQQEENQCLSRDLEETKEGLELYHGLIKQLKQEREELIKKLKEVCTHFNVTDPAGIEHIVVELDDAIQFLKPKEEPK
jgi:predicted RNase H-like nuclease (RuvC/YqgF family)